MKKYKTDTEIPKEVQEFREQRAKEMVEHFHLDEKSLVFFDFDGTLTSINDTRRAEDIAFYLTDDISDRNPFPHMQEIIKLLDPDKIYILGHMQTHNEVDMKRAWITKNYPQFKLENMIFIAYPFSKGQAMKAVMETRGLKSLKMNYSKYSDVVLIDDKAEILQDVLENSFDAIHTTQLI